VKYVGSKSRVSKYILHLMLPYRGNRPWVEPFVGGGNMIDKVEGKRIGYDNNIYAIEALKLIRDNVESLPKNKNETSESFYNEIKKSNDYAIGLKGYYGFSLSFGGKFFGGWRRDKQGKRDYINEAYRNALKQSKKIQGVHFETKNYYDIELSEPSLIYCDPPYKGTYNYNIYFDYHLFYDWCRSMKSLRHIVFISEYDSPFNCIWEKDYCSSLDLNTGGKHNKEKLFII